VLVCPFERSSASNLLIATLPDPKIERPPSTHWPCPLVFQNPASRNFVPCPCVPLGASIARPAPPQIVAWCFCQALGAEYSRPGPFNLPRLCQAGAFPRSLPAVPPSLFRTTFFPQFNTDRHHQLIQPFKPRPPTTRCDNRSSANKSTLGQPQWPLVSVELDCCDSGAQLVALLPNGSPRLVCFLSLRLRTPLLSWPQSFVFAILF